MPASVLTRDMTRPAGPTFRCSPTWGHCQGEGIPKPVRCEWEHRGLEGPGRLAGSWVCVSQMAACFRQKRPPGRGGAPLPGAQFGEEADFPGGQIPASGCGHRAAPAGLSSLLVLLGAPPEAGSWVEPRGAEALQAQERRWPPRHCPWAARCRRSGGRGAPGGPGEGCPCAPRPGPGSTPFPRRAAVPCRDPPPAARPGQWPVTGRGGPGGGRRGRACSLGP